MEQRKSNLAKFSVALVILIIITIGIWYYKQNKTEVVIANPVVIQSYKDGIYTAMGTYISPAGKEDIGLSLTLKNNTIIDINFTSKATNEVSIKLQGMFASGYKELVIGKDISTVKLDKVSGSSLTPKGFNDAIEKIKLQAKA